MADLPPIPRPQHRLPTQHLTSHTAGATRQTNRPTAAHARGPALQALRASHRLVDHPLHLHPPWRPAAPPSRTTQCDKQGPSSADCNKDEQTHLQAIMPIPSSSRHVACTCGEARQVAIHTSSNGASQWQGTQHHASAAASTPAARSSSQSSWQWPARRWCTRAAAGTQRTQRPALHLHAWHATWPCSSTLHHDRTLRQGGSRAEKAQQPHFQEPRPSVGEQRDSRSAVECAQPTG